MEIMKVNLVPKESGTGALFTGGEVTRQRLLGPEMRRHLNLAIVNFGEGARTKFHKHTTDQVLIIIAGKGIVATEQEEQTVGLGDIVFFPAGEKHWHGATKDSDFSHIYVLSIDSETTQLED